MHRNRRQRCKRGIFEYAKEAAGYYRLLLLNLYSINDMQANVDVIKNNYMPNGLHPSDNDPRQIAEKLHGFLKAV